MEKQYVKDKQKPFEKNIKIAPAPIQDNKEQEKAETKTEEITSSDETKVPEKKKEKKEIIKKTEACVNGKDLGISMKTSRDICKFINGKTIEKSLFELEEILLHKRALPMKGEIPHRRGNIMSGRYPENAIKEIIKLLKSLRANAYINNMDNPVISEAIANKASTPHRKAGRRFKRTHVSIKVKEKNIKQEIKTEKK